MKSFYKYIICFLLGIIIFYLLFKENNIEGIVFDQDPSQLNRGCSHYTCKNDPSKYDNYQTKRYSSGTAPSEYNNCLPISEQEIYHKRGTDEDHQPLSEGPVNLCTNDICCENFICSENAENITCPDGQMFLPNNKCDLNISVEEACTEVRCCSVSLTGEEERNVNSLEELFDEIIEFRDTHGGKNNGLYITGEDILFYLYNSFLDIKQMSEVLVPLEFDSERFPDTDVLDTLRSNINTILKGENVGDNNITETYSENDYKNKPVFFNNDVKLVLKFNNDNDNDNCSYNLNQRSISINNKENYFPQDCIGYNNKIERYAFYKNISSYDYNVSLRLKDSNNTLEDMANFIINGDLNFNESIGSGLYEPNGRSACQDIDINYPMVNALTSDHSGFIFTIGEKSIRTGNERYSIQNSDSQSFTINGLQKLKTPPETEELEIYDTYKVLKSKEDMNYSEYRFLNEWLNTISLDDDTEIDRKIILNKVFNISNVSSTTYTNGYDSNGVQIVDNHGPFDAIHEGIDIPKGSDITITSGGTDYKSKNNNRIVEGTNSLITTGLPNNLDIYDSDMVFSYTYTKTMDAPCNIDLRLSCDYTEDQCIAGYEHNDGGIKDISDYSGLPQPDTIWNNWYESWQEERQINNELQLQNINELVDIMRSYCCKSCFPNYGETTISGTLTSSRISSNSALNSIITGNSEYTVDDDELNLKKLILNLDKSTSYHNLKPLDKLFHTYLGSNKNTLISKEMFIGLNE